MNSDCFFTIGRSHTICQDYAIKIEEASACILADGCSSSKNTDVGSRILLHTLKQQIHLFNPLNIETFLYNTLQKSREIASTMGLENECLNCTLILTLVHKGIIYVISIGDGLISVVFKDGSSGVISHHYENNTPFYLNYFDYCDISSHPSLKVDYDGLVYEKPFNSINIYTFLEKDVLCVNTLSDGIFSFIDSKGLIDSSIIMKEILAVKNYSGSFIERRIKRMLKNFNKEGIINEDDLSITSLYLGE